MPWKDNLHDFQNLLDTANAWLMAEAGLIAFYSSNIYTLTRDCLPTVYLTIYFRSFLQNTAFDE
jgi:hypothetical protein